MKVTTLLLFLFTYNFCFPSNNDLILEHLNSSKNTLCLSSKKADIVSKLQLTKCLKEISIKLRCEFESSSECVSAHFKILSKEEIKPKGSEKKFDYAAYDFSSNTIGIDPYVFSFRGKQTIKEFIYNFAVIFTHELGHYILDNSKLFSFSKKYESIFESSVIEEEKGEPFDTGQQKKMSDIIEVHAVHEFFSDLLVYIATKNPEALFKAISTFDGKRKHLFRKVSLCDAQTISDTIYFGRMFKKFTSEIEVDFYSLFGPSLCSFFQKNNPSVLNQREPQAIAKLINSLDQFIVENLSWIETNAIRKEYPLNLLDQNIEIHYDTKSYQYKSSKILFPHEVYLNLEAEIIENYNNHVMPKLGDIYNLPKTPGKFKMPFPEILFYQIKRLNRVLQNYF